MTARCQGGCEKMVTVAGMWCSSCWVVDTTGAADRQIVSQTIKSVFPDPIRPAQDLQSIRFEIHSASFRLCFGRESEREHALETLSHLVSVLQQETHINKQTKKED